MRTPCRTRPDTSSRELIGAPIGGSETTELAGRNVEFAGDRAGYFRYTQMTVGLTHPVDIVPEEKTDRIAEQVVSAANVLIDAYRYATGRAYLPRLRLADLLFVQVHYPMSNELEYLGLFSKGLRIAVVNDGRDAHDQVREMGRTGGSVPIHADLLLAAIRALWENDHRLSVIEAVTALEVFVDSRLHFSLVQGQKMTEDEFETYMRQDGRVLSDRMKKPIRRIGLRSPSDDQILWRRWLSTNALRRKVIHAGYEVTEEEAKTVVRVVQELLQKMGDSGMHLAEEMPS